MAKLDKISNQSRWKLFLTIFSFAVFLILIITLRDQIADAIHNLGKVNAWALLLIIPLEAINYDAYARLFRHLFGMFGEKTEYRHMYKVQLELNFVNHILPSGGVSGISYFALRMKALNISTAKSTLVQVMMRILLYISFEPLLILGLIFLSMEGQANNFTIAIASSLITLVIIGTFISIYILDSRSRINSFLTFMTKAINKVVHLVRPRSPETINIENAQSAFNELHDNYGVLKKNWQNLKKPLFYTFIADVTEVAGLYIVYVAFGEFPNVGAIILAYAVANFAGLISVLPAGIGIYEALMTAVLAATGIPVALSIPVTIMFRVISMSVQLIPGYIFYQKAVKDGLSTKI
jgi:uncharacterized protein (TIRG00374 family)